MSGTSATSSNDKRGVSGASEKANLKGGSPDDSRAVIESTRNAKKRRTNLLDTSEVQSEPSAQNSSKRSVPVTLFNADNQQASSRETEPEETGRPSKKPRLEVEDSSTTESDLPKVESPMLNLPLELLAEILIFTGSPRHVLAIARTCKALCRTLLGEDAQFIWRAARRGSGCSVSPASSRDIISLPDPPKAFFTEAAYAAFLFDPGTCDVCGKQTSVPYASFALRIRLCNNTKCRRIPDTIQINGSEESRLVLPINEVGLPFASGVRSYCPYATWPTQKYSRLAALVEFHEEYRVRRDDEDYKKEFESRRNRNTAWMEFCVKLSQWRIAYDQRLQVVKGLNIEAARRMADSFGWDCDRLIGCTIFGPFLRHKTNLLEVITFVEEVLPLRDQIESDLLKLEEKRRRRKAEISLMENRKDIEELYNRLRSKKTYKYLPSLPTFRQLPVVQLLQSGVHDGKRETKITNTLQNNPVMRQQLDHEVEQWIEKAKNDLAVVLGFPNEWKTASKKILHPVERSTAWFLCTKCVSVETNYKMDGCLDFAGACLHICQGKNGKNDRFRKGKRAAWNPKNFIRDEKAIKVMKKVLQTFHLPEDTDRGYYFRRTSAAVVCTSCNPPIVLDSRSLIGHCHRHDDMQLSMKFSKETIVSYLKGFPYEHGIVTKLLRHGGLAIQREIDRKIYNCRLCFPGKQIEEAVRADATTTEGVQGPPNIAGGDGVYAYISLEHVSRGMQRRLESSQEKCAWFNFNGLRSHLKAKHGFESIRDEDVLCLEVVDLKGDKTDKLLDSFIFT